MILLLLCGVLVLSLPKFLVNLLLNDSPMSEVSCEAQIILVAALRESALIVSQRFFWRPLLCRVSTGPALAHFNLIDCPRETVNEHQGNASVMEGKNKLFYYSRDGNDRMGNRKVNQSNFTAFSNLLSFWLLRTEFLTEICDSAIAVNQYDV